MDWDTELCNNVNSSKIDLWINAIPIKILAGFLNQQADSKIYVEMYRNKYNGI